MKSNNINAPVIIQAPKDLASQANGLFAWVFDASGTLLESQPIKNGQAKLKTDARQLRSQVKLYIAPEVPEVMKKRVITERLLQQAGAYQPSIRLRDGNILDLIRIPDINIFRFRICHIAGTVSKNFIIDGVGQVLPVCNVRVHICEVDPIWFLLPKIPDLDIIDIRDRLREVIILENPPIPDPIGPVSGLLTTRLIQATQLSRQAKSLPTLKSDVVSQLASNSVDTLRRTLHSNFQVLLPYLCLFPRRWPFLYHCEEIATVQTDCNGRFEQTYVYFENGDQPDIYVWIEANINGSWQTVYKPAKACGTHWNYQCGTDINIRLTDDRLTPCECAPLPGQVVWMKRVNDGISIRNIQQNTSGSVHLANAIGLTNAYTPSDFTSPFGKSFPFVVQFGSGFPSANVTHYRWKYKQLKSASLSNVSDTPHALEGAIAKAYTYERVNSDGDTVFYTGAFKLGPEPSAHGSIFRIPHSEASVDVPAEPTAEWNQDTYSVNIDSMNLDDGLYEFTFELLDANGNVVPQDKDVFVVDKKAGEASNPADAPTITAFGRPENYVILNGSNQALSFRFVLRVDNDACFADIKNALVDGTATETVCGFGQYNDKNTSKVTLVFEARHPQNFGHYGFSVVKGNSNPAGPTNTSGYVTQANDGYSVSSNILSKPVDVSAMLGVCSKAAFAENLYIEATHTNGARRLSEYDHSDTAAFAIEPK